ncbi:hypothetical protein J2W96_007075 [Variovorax guangxiensis]|nr:hypothetical protein [Variovorax guangxiensis]
MHEPPSIDKGEVTDKGSINQRAVLKHRDALVQAFHGDQLPFTLKPSELLQIRSDSLLVVPHLPNGAARRARSSGHRYRGLRNLLSLQPCRRVDAIQAHVVAQIHDHVEQAPVFPKFGTFFIYLLLIAQMIWRPTAFDRRGIKRKPEVVRPQDPALSDHRTRA